MYTRRYGFFLRNLTRTFLQLPQVFKFNVIYCRFAGHCQFSYAGPQEVECMTDEEIEALDISPADKEKKKAEVSSFL